MKALNVIPKVESIWRCSTDAEDLAIIKIDGNYVEWSDGSTSILEGGYLDETFTFKPANDLEWLAVNCDEWIDNISYQYITKVGNEFERANTSYNGKKFTKKQWQDKRDELYGITEELAEDKPAKVNMITKYVKVDIGDTTKHHMRELYFHWSDEKIESLSTVDACTMLINQHKLRLKVERPITWQEALTDLQKHRDTFTVKPSGVLINEFIPAGSFIEICRLVTSLTKGE